MALALFEHAQKVHDALAAHVQSAVELVAAGDYVGARVQLQIADGLAGELDEISGILDRSEKRLDALKADIAAEPPILATG